ncbi:MAG: caspase family protein [Alphaproteobacteria bacterium]|nr:caspase family protein [Alphaproteobacteria bacterium]MBL7099745.1 caspase family protein [Alphaproteobacteria bacterium]
MRWLSVLAACAALALAGEAPAPRIAKHAILVGVEDYETLPGVTLFQGPRNSVLLWHDYLRAQGFTDITVLSEGMDAGDVKWAKSDPHVGAPTRANIQKALGDLEKRLAATPGKDDVVIVLAGHGSQQRAMPWDPPKPDNLDEVFLPGDAGPRPASDPEGPFRNALVDHDIAPHLKTLAKHAGFIWLIFDSCHSDTMTYDALLLRKKPSMAAMSDLSYAARPAAHPLIPAPKDPPPAFGPSPRDRDWPKNYVAFFASASDQTTPLIVADAPPDAAKRIGSGPSRFTAFSYFILDALRKNPHARFDDIIASVGKAYRIQYPADTFEPKVEGGSRLQLPASTVLH